MVELVVDVVSDQGLEPGSPYASMMRQVFVGEQVGEHQDRNIGINLGDLADRRTHPGPFVTGQGVLVRVEGVELLKGVFGEPALEGPKARRPGARFVLARHPKELLVRPRSDSVPEAGGLGSVANDDAASHASPVRLWPRISGCFRNSGGCPLAGPGIRPRPPSLAPFGAGGLRGGWGSGSAGGRDSIPLILKVISSRRRYCRPPMAVCDDPPDSDFDEPIVVPIEEAFDLHSFRPADVLAVVDAYLDEAILRGFREVRLIHGRGKGVQRAQLRRFLAQDPRVEEFVQAPPERGGWGATLARLRTNERPEDSD